MKTYIIIVTYNGMKWLNECLESTKPYPVIVVDNGSSDGTQDYIKSNYPQIDLLQQDENLGFGKANNIGIVHALEKDADFVFLLNQDAYLKPQVIDILVKISQNNPDYGVVSPIHLTGDGEGLEEVFNYYITKEKRNELLADLILKKDLKEIYDIEMINAAAWLLPKMTLETVGGFHPMFFLYGEDDNYCQRVAYHNLKIGISPNVFVRHDSSNNYHLEQIKGSDKFFKKFLNQIKVEYANINVDNKGKFEKLKLHYLKEGIISLLKLDIPEYKFNIKKWKLIKDLHFNVDIEEGRKRKRHYLQP